MQAECLWQETCVNRCEGEILAEDVHSDVAIIGGGFTGLRAAIELAKSGTSVAVLEASEIGSGASGLNGGQVNPMLPVASPHTLRESVGDNWFESMTRASLRSADDLFDFIEEHQIACDARQRGWLRAQHSQKARKSAIMAAREWNKFGARFEEVGADEAARLSGSSAYVGGIITPDGGAVHPLSLTFGMAQTARKQGVRIFQNSPVTALDRTGDKWNLKAANCNIKSDAVIVATNGYTDKLVPGLKGSILPMTPIQIATEPLDDDIAESLLPDGHTISDTQRLIMYCRKEPDNRFVYGGIGYASGGGTLNGFNWLREDAVRVFPQLREAKFSYQWGGRIALTDNRIPHFHEPAPGLFVGLGYNGRGVAMSSLMGKNLAARARGAAPDTLDFPTTNISHYRFGKFQKFGSGLAIRFMRLLDWMEFRS